MRIKSYKIFLESARHEISKGEEYLVDAWHPESSSWRFHISTKTSNPFKISKNKLSILYE